MTPFDNAVISQSVATLRRLEAAAPFAGLLAVKESKWGGLGSAWLPRWVSVVYRLPGPAAPPSERVVRKVLSYYRSADAVNPFLKVRQ